MEVTIETHRTILFFQLLEQGILVNGRIGESVRDFLVNRLGVENEYLESRIQTVFLSGKPVDDLDHTYIQNGSVVALSAAMPGLVGSTLRRGGHYASMRSGISEQMGRKLESNESVDVTVKLFNLVRKELGEQLFQQGIRISALQLGRILSDQEIVLKIKSRERGSSRD
ncbi:MAG: hypothetical protein AB1659_00450 [Thermodesulfobacteriota bacterium]